jgi:hypothetical protein
MDSNTSTPADFGASPGAVSAGPEGLAAGPEGLAAGPEGLAAGPEGLAAGPEGLAAGPEGLPAGLEGLAAAVAELAAGDPDEHGDAALAAEVLALRRLADQLDGAWLRLLAVVDARGAAGAEHGIAALSTAGWLRAALRMSAAGAGRAVRTARALHRGPLKGTARALARGQVSVEHATVLAEVTAELPAARVAEAEGVLVDAARRLDPGRLRRLTSHLRGVLDPDGAEQRGRARWERRGLWLSATVDGMVAVDGLLDPEASETVRSALLPLARPTGPDDGRSAAQRRADGLAELARWGLQAGRLPRAGGLRPQVTVTVELASLLAERGGPGGTGGWGGVLPGESVRRLCCDATVTRAIVHRPPAYTGQAVTNLGHAGHATGHPGTSGAHAGHATSPPGTHGGHAAGHPGSSGAGTSHDDGGLAGRLRSAVALLPAPLGAPTQLLDLGRATRVVGPALRRALTVRDGGCVAAGCDRPAPWTDAHHLVHWLDGGATSLDNLVLLCRVHHRAVHEGSWQLHRDPGSGRVILTPPARRHRSPPAA